MVNTIVGGNCAPRHYKDNNRGHKCHNRRGGRGGRIDDRDARDRLPSDGEHRDYPEDIRDPRQHFKPAAESDMSFAEKWSLRTSGLFCNRKMSPTQSHCH